MATTTEVSSSRGSQWTIREQLILASAVQRSGDQNWVSVSRAIKPIMEDVRPTDFFSQKNCALQYGAMIDKIPNKRKKRASEDGAETREQQIVRELGEKRINELDKSLAEIRKEYVALTKEVELLEKGELDEKVPELWEKLKLEPAEDAESVLEGCITSTSKPSMASSGISTTQHVTKPVSTVKQISSLIESSVAIPQASIKTETNLPQTAVKEKGVSVKKEPLSSTPTPTDSENKLTQLPSLGEDKILSPMQTPLPTSSGQPLIANLHIIVQQRNEAVENLLAKTDNKNTKTDNKSANTESTSSQSIMNTNIATSSKGVVAPTVTQLSTILPAIPTPSSSAISTSPRPSMSMAIPSPVKEPVQSQAVQPSQTVQGQATQLSQSVQSQATQLSQTVQSQATQLSQTVQSQATQLSQTVQSQAIQLSRTVQSQAIQPSQTVQGQATQLSRSVQSQATQLSQTVQSQAIQLSQTVPIMAYLSKTQAVSQPTTKRSFLQSLVSQAVPAIPTSTPTSTPASLGRQSNPPVTSSPIVSPSLTILASHVTSPIATATVSAPVMTASPVKKVAPVAIITSATVSSRTSIVTVQPAPVQIPTNSAQPKIAAVAVPSSTIPTALSKPASTVPSAQATSTNVTPLVKSLTEVAASKKSLMVASTTNSVTIVPNFRLDDTKDIKTLLALPPTTTTPSKPSPQKSREAPQSVKQSIETNTSIKQDTDTNQNVGATPIKMESEMSAEAAHNTPHTPLSTVGSVTPIPAVVMETQDADIEEDTPTKVKKGYSMLKKSLLTRSRKRKVEDEGLSVESTDTEEDGQSSQTASAVPSPAPSHSSEIDVDAVRAHKQWKKGIMLVWRHAAQHKYANFFLHPVREEDAPGYKDVVFSPTDLSTIKRKLESGQIKNDVEFQREMLLMFQNAFMYNSSDHEVYHIAQEMKSDVMENLQTYLATQAQLQLIEDPVPTKTLRGRRGDRDHSHDDSLFSPATKKRRTRTDDRD